jgi:hypothetical protein
MSIIAFIYSSVSKAEVVLEEENKRKEIIYNYERIFSKK